jgi:nicotinamidase-related amidase
MNRALLIIDIQNDYFAGGAMPLQGSEAASEQAARLLAAFRAARLPVVHIQHLSLRPGAGFFLPGSPGADIHESVRPEPDEPVLLKHFPNSFRDTDLETHFRELKIRHLTVAGMMTHMCIDATVRAAFDLGFACDLAHDACATRDLEFAGQSVAAQQVQGAFLASLNGLFAKVDSAQALSARL